MRGPGSLSVFLRFCTHWTLWVFIILLYEPFSGLSRNARHHSEGISSEFIFFVKGLQRFVRQRLHV